MCVLARCDGDFTVRFRLRRFDVCVCQSCGTIFRYPLPSDDEMRVMYEDPAYHATRYFADPLTEPDASGSPEVEIYAAALERLDRMVNRDAGRSGFLLDVGCGSGTFLRLARERGWSVEGMELSDQLVSSAVSRFGLDVRCGDFLDTNPAHTQYDVIAMWDLLEHVVDPEAVLARARSLLAQHGVLVILTIDSSSLFNLLGEISYRASLGRFDRPVELLFDARHNYYFDGPSLERILAAAGYSIRLRTPHRAHLGRWLSEPVPAWIRLAGGLVDFASALVGRQYRQLLYCTAADR